MTYSRIAGFLSMAVLFALVLGVTFAERSFAQTTTTVEILATDLVDDPAGDNAKDAYVKVNAKIATATAAGTVVTFPSGTFEDVGEILIVGIKGKAAVPASGSTAAVAANPITFRGSNTVFTGKIMFNVQNSQDIVIEGFTFRDTKIPDEATFSYQGAQKETPDTEATSGTGAAFTMAEKDVTGTVWLNTSFLEAMANDGCPAGEPINNVTVRNNMFMNTVQHGVKAGAMAISGYAQYITCNSSAVTISGNRFMGIGMGPNAVYLDTAKTVPGLLNRESAIEGAKTIGWTVRGNVIGMDAEGMDASGTTANGIKLDIALGKTLVRDNMVNNAAWSGIVVGGDGSTGNDGVADADEAEITIANNTVTNSRNDPYITSWWAAAVPAEGYTVEPWRFSAERLTAATVQTDESVDGLLKATVWKRPTGHTRPYLGGVRRVDSILEGTYSSGARMNSIVDQSATQGEPDKIFDASTVRWLRGGVEAGLELNRLTAKTLSVENNELTGNVVGLVVCPASYCYAKSNADGTYSVLAKAGLTPEEVLTAGLKVPTLTANRIYDNRKDTDMPRSFVRADVVNALTTANVTGSNVLVLAGNYLGDRPEVEGAANDDDLAMVDDVNVGPKETVPPALSTDGATFMGTSVTLMYGEALDGESVPAAAAFTVTQMDSAGLSGPITVSSVAVAGMSVTLTLAKAPGSGNSVTVSYDPAKAGGNPIQDVAGNVAAALSGQVVSMTPEPVDPGTEMPPTEMPPAAAGGDGGCALASGGSGIDLGMLLLTVVPFAFVLVRRAKEAV